MEWKENICSGITWNGTYYSQTEITAFPVLDPDSFQGKFLAFLREWWSDSPFISVQTSGSTGKPKEILVEKKRMMHSAGMTCSFLGLKKGDRALLCMPLDFIAGKMMVVRALVYGLDLWVTPPTSNPLDGKEFPPLQFTAMVPIQVYHSMKNEKEYLSSIRHLIIGGGGIDTDMENCLHEFPHYVWSTYGMTETLSHIALRQINGKDSSLYYTPFKGVSLSLSSRNTLIIEAPALSPVKIRTNDIAELRPDGRFRILGRKDNVICSGGIKIQIEDVEVILKNGLSSPFAVSWVPDARLGQCVVLLLESEDNTPLPGNLEKLLQQLPPYQKPRYIFRIPLLPRTGTGKPSRKAIQEYCSGLLKKRVK